MPSLLEQGWLDGIPCTGAWGVAAALQVTMPRRDPSQLEPGDVLFCFPRGEVHRREVLAIAEERVAALVVAEQPALPQTSLPVVYTPSVREAFAHASVVSHGLDHRCPSLWGITGTDGKTTSLWFLWHCLGPGAGRVGTLGMHNGVEEQQSGHTTPPSDVLHAFLQDCAVNGPGVGIELSSIALDQDRCGGLKFSGLIYTGLGTDHLGYHGTEDAYLAAKLKALEQLVPGSVVIIPAADTHASLWRQRAADLGMQVVSLGYEADTGADYFLELSGQSWMVHSTAKAQEPFALPLDMPGAYNAWNAAAAVLLAGAAGRSVSQCQQALQQMPPVPGRLQMISAGNANVYIDYAHTTQGVSLALEALREQYGQRPLVCVVGCGGDRDASKRAPMGLAASAADQLIITTDNARSEDPKSIAQAMCQDLTPGTIAWEAQPATKAVWVLLDRGAAIRAAIDYAQAHDGIALICGKGHEQVQVIAGQSLPWHDASCVMAYVQGEVYAP